MKMRLMQAVVAACCCCLTQGARAEWLTSQNGPDVFGKTTFFASGIERMTDSLVVRCDQANQLDIAYIVRTSDSDIQATVTGQLLIQTASGSPALRLDAQLQKWNDMYDGFVVSGRTPAVVSAVRAIGNATGGINIGIDVAGHQFTAELSSSGSTAAIATIVKECKLDDIPTNAPASPTG